MNLATLYFAIFTFCLFPRLVSGYDLVGGLSLFDFEPPSDWFDTDWFDATATLSAMIRRRQDAFQHAFFRGASAFYSSPRYEMANDANLFQVRMELGAEMKLSDVEIQFDEFRRLLTISSHKESTNDESGYRFNSQFSQSFSVDPFVQADQLTATVENGVLTVSAPRDSDRMQHSVRSIPVVQQARIEAPKNPQEEEPEPTMEALDKYIKVAPDESKDSDSDPFHVKERVQKAQRATNEGHDSMDKPGRNPIENLLEQGMEKAYKASELRRR